MQFWAVCSIFSTITLSKPQITTWDPYNSCICFYTDKANATVTYKLLHTKLCINLQYQTTYQNAYHTAVNRKFSCVHQTGALYCAPIQCVHSKPTPLTPPSASLVFVTTRIHTLRIYIPMLHAYRQLTSKNNNRNTWLLVLQLSELTTYNLGFSCKHSLINHHTFLQLLS